MFDGNGKVDTVVFRLTLAGRFSVRITLSGTIPSRRIAQAPSPLRMVRSSDLFIAPDGSMFTFVETGSLVYCDVGG